MTSLRVALNFILLVFLGVVAGCGEEANSNAKIDAMQKSDNLAPDVKPARDPVAATTDSAPITEPAPTPKPASTQDSPPKAPAQAPESSSPPPPTPPDSPAPSPQGVQASLGERVVDAVEIDAYGFDNKGIHVATGKTRDPLGFNKQGIDEEYYDRNGFNSKGFRRSGIHRDTKTKFNTEGYDRNGYDIHGFNDKRIHRDTQTLFDGKGFDRDGFSKRGFGKNGLHRDTHTEYDLRNLNKHGYTYDGYNYEGFRKSGVDRSWRVSFVSRATKIIKAGDKAKEDLKNGKPVSLSVKGEALKLLKEMGSWFKLNSGTLKPLFRKLSLKFHPDHCKQERAAIIAATSGQGFPEDMDEERCTAAQTIAVGLYDLAK